MPTLQLIKKKEDQAMNRTDEDVLKYGYFLFCWEKKFFRNKIAFCPVKTNLKQLTTSFRKKDLNV